MSPALTARRSQTTDLVQRGGTQFAPNSVRFRHHLVAPSSPDRQSLIAEGGQANIVDGAPVTWLYGWSRR